MQSRHARRRPVRGLLVLGLLLPVAAASGLLLRAPATPDPPDDTADAVTPAAAPAAGPVAGPVARAAAVLRSWDEARAAAWARGSVRALRRLYAERAGASDVRLLESYLDRGLRVERMRTQVLALAVLAHRPGEWRLRVTDRLASGTAVRAGDRQRLPRDQATTRMLCLVSVDGAWRIAAVR